jgi:hypothetical protein
MQGRIPSWNFTGSQTVPPKRKSLVASLQKNSLNGIELRAQSTVQVGEYSLINEKATHLCEAFPYPERTKVANGL